MRPSLPQFILRLQAAPPAAELHAAEGGQALDSVRSVRLWAQQDGADVGVEFSLVQRRPDG